MPSRPIERGRTAHPKYDPILITDGETGISLNPTEVVPTAIAALQALDKDRNRFAKIAQNAAGKPDRWQQTPPLSSHALSNRCTKGV